MAVETILFFGGVLHHTNSSASITASATATGGYHVDHLRDSNLRTAWKANDSTTVSFNLVLDTGTFPTSGISTIGNDGETAYIAIAYDARNNEQDRLALQYDTADSSSFSSPAHIDYVNLTKNGSRVECQYMSFTIPAIGGNPPRYYRLVGDGAERSEAAGDNVPKIYYVEMFDKDNVVRLGTSPYASDTPGAGEVTPFARVGMARSIIGTATTNKVAAAGVRFQINFQPATEALWEKVRDSLADQGGPNRANFVQHEGLKNTDDPEFFLCRLVSPEFPGVRSYVDVMESGLTWETEPWL